MNPSALICIIVANFDKMNFSCCDKSITTIGFTSTVTIIGFKVSTYTALSRQVERHPVTLNSYSHLFTELWPWNMITLIVKVGNSDEIFIWVASSDNLNSHLQNELCFFQIWKHFYIIFYIIVILSDLSASLSFGAPETCIKLHSWRSTWCFMLG